MPCEGHPCRKPQTGSLKQAHNPHTDPNVQDKHLTAHGVLSRGVCTWRDACGTLWHQLAYATTVADLRLHAVLHRRAPLGIGAFLEPTYVCQQRSRRLCLLKCCNRPVGTTNAKHGGQHRVRHSGVYVAASCTVTWPNTRHEATVCNSLSRASHAVRHCSLV